MTRKTATRLIALGLAVLLPAAITGCSNVKSVPASSTAAMPLPQVSSAPEAEPVFSQKNPEPVRVNLPLADQDGL